MKSLRDVSLKTRIALAVSALFVVCIGAIASWALTLFAQERENAQSLEAVSFVAAMADSIDTKLTLLHNTVIAAAATVPVAALSNADVAQVFLDQQAALHSLFDNGLFLISMDSRLVAESPFKPDRRGLDLKAREFIQQTIASRKPYISKPYRSTHNPGQPAVIMTAPVFDREGKMIGLLEGSIDLLGANVLADLSKVRFGKTGYMYLADGRQTMISHPDKNRIMETVAVKGQNLLYDRALDEGWEGAGETVTSRGIPMLAAARRLKSTGWVIGVNLPLSEFKAPVRDAQRYFLVSIALGVLVVLAMVWLLIQRLIEPLSTMTRQINVMANEAGAQAQLTIRSKDEIGVLGSAFNRMLEKLLRLNAELKERVIERTQALETIAERESEINQLAFSDSLTGLPNRRRLIDRLEHALAVSARNKRLGAILFIDLDDFKSLNDTLGHDMGDLLLQQVAKRLSTCVREGDTVARLGGDEFVVMLEDLSETPEDAATQAKSVGEKILDTLSESYQLASYQHRNTPSIGITLFSAHQESVDELLKRADLAMYQAKAAGRNTLRFFDPLMQVAVSERVAMEVDLREALRQGQFFLHYQAQVDAMGRLTGAEALVRWQHPQRGVVYPSDFISLAEVTGLILPLGLWVLKTACAQLGAWSKRPEAAHLTLAVNVSARQFRHPDFIAQVVDAMAQYGIGPGRLKLELTESLMLEDVESIIATMNTLKSHGVSFSLDDFGTGYSSLSYLKRLPLEQLKIDRSFVRDLLTDSNDAAIVRTTFALAQSLGLKVIAEGMETGDQHDLLAQMGCQAYQGYFFGRPGPAEDLEKFFKPKSS